MKKQEKLRVLRRKANVRRRDAIKDFPEYVGELPLRLDGEHEQDTPAARRRVAEQIIKEGKLRYYIAPGGPGYSAKLICIPLLRGNVKQRRDEYSKMDIEDIESIKRNPWCTVDDL